MSASKRYTPYPRWAPYFFATPFLFTFLVFALYPLVQSMVLATQNTFGAEITEFVGFANFKFLLTDPQFGKALINTFLFACGSVFLQLPVSLGLALLLNRPDIIGRGFWRLIFFSPSMVGIVFVAMIGSLIFEKRTGLLNVGLAWISGGAWDIDFPWLQEFVMPALILSALWMYAGFNMVYFLAALQSVDKTLLEAAKVDGANAWHRFVHVTLPCIMPVATFILLLSIIGSFQLFELPYIMLGGPGPNDQGLTVVMYLFTTAFEAGDLGYGSAIGWGLAVILITFAMGQRIIGRKTEA